MTDETNTNSRAAPTWYGALGRRSNTPGQPVAVPGPSGDPMLDLVNEWRLLANRYAGPPDSMKVLALLYSRESEGTIAALADPPVPTTIAGCLAALDMVIAEGVLAGDGVAVVRAATEALRRGVG